MVIMQDSEDGFWFRVDGWGKFDLLFAPSWKEVIA